MTVDGEILEVAAAAPARLALVDAETGRSLTFGQLADGVRRVAGGLAARGVGRGDVVALVAGNSPEYAVAAYGALAAGAAVAGANPRLTGGELARFFAAARPRLVLADVPVPEPGAPVVRSVGELLGPPAPDRAGRSPDDPAFFFCSSGTSGLPKLAVHTHRGACAFLRAFAALPATRLGPADVVAPAVPFTHLYGTAVLTYALLARARVVTVPLVPAPLIRALATHGVSAAFLSPPALPVLAHHPRPGELSALRRVYSSAAPLAPELRDAVAARLGCPVSDCVGMTEAWAFTADGQLLPGVEARIADPVSGRPLGPGTPGELWLRGPQVMAGYHDGSGLGPDGWLRTGDLCALG